MNKSELLFYDAYEEFYAMAKKSRAFAAFCRDAFGEDFSQDGFSDVNQINLIFEHIPQGDGVHILDIGCGNGKLLGYLQSKTGAYIHGFDYSSQAIASAKNMFTHMADFREGIIGEVNYPAESFDVIISMDTMYFAEDMTTFTAQIKSWLKPDGVFFAGYQEGDVMPKTDGVYTSVLTKALEANGMKYTVSDITQQTFNLLCRKREAAERHHAEFEAEGQEQWYDLLMLQTDCITEGYEKFSQSMARYIYTAKK